MGSTKPRTTGVLHKGRLVQDILDAGMFSVATFASAKMASKIPGEFLLTRGHTVEGKGGAIYRRLSSTGVPSTGDELEFADADGVVWRYQPQGDRYDAEAFGLVADNPSAAGSNSDKLQAMIDRTQRADFLGGSFYFNKFKDNSPNTKLACVVLSKKTHIQTHNGSVLHMVATPPSAEENMYPYLFGASYDSAASGSSFKCKVFIDGAGGMGIFRFVHDTDFSECYIHGGSHKDVTMNTASRAALVLWGCHRFRVNNCTMYAATDSADYSTAKLAHQWFGIRALTRFVKEADQTFYSEGGRITNSTFVGFVYNAVEIGGTGTTDARVDDNKFIDCALTPLDLDKGCKNCHGSRNVIIRPKRGVVTTEGMGGGAWIPMRIQGYVVDGELIYAQDCSLTDNVIVGANLSGSTSDAPDFVLVSAAKNCLVARNKSRLSLYRIAFTVQDADDTMILDNECKAVDGMLYNSHNSDSLILKGNRVSVTNTVINTGTSGNGFAGMRRMDISNNVFRYVGTAPKTTDGMYFRINTTFCSGIVANNAFHDFKRPYVVQAGSGNKVLLRNNTGVNCTETPVIADGNSREIGYESFAM